MYSRIGRARFRTEKGDEVVRVARESVATFQRQPGFQSVAFHYDRASGWGVAVCCRTPKSAGIWTDDGDHDVGGLARGALRVTSAARRR